MVPELVGEHDVHLGGREPAVEQRVPEDDAARGADAEGERIRLARLLADRFDAEWDPVQPFGTFEPVEARDERRIVGPLEARVEVRGDEHAQRRDRREDGRAGNPPPRAEPSREPHDDEQRDADGDERRPESDPVAEDGVEVPHVRDAVSAAPPQPHNGDGQLGQPEDRQPQHPEEHPRPERPGGGLLGEPAAVARVDRERPDRHDDPEHPEDQEEALVPLGTIDERLAEDGVDVDVGEGQPVRDDGAPQQPREPDPAHDERRVEGDPERLHRTSIGSNGTGTGAGAGGGGLSAGEESG